MDIEYYKNYQGPNLIKATLNNEDITEKLRNIYGKKNNWQGKLWKYKEVFGNNCNNKDFYCEFCCENKRKHWFNGSIKDIDQYFNPPLFTPINQI